MLALLLGFLAMTVVGLAAYPLVKRTFKADVWWVLLSAIAASILISLVAIKINLVYQLTIGQLLGLVLVLAACASSVIVGAKHFSAGLIGEAELESPGDRGTAIIHVRRFGFIFLVIFTPILVGGLFFDFCFRSYYPDIIAPNVFVEYVEVSGLTQSDARDKLSKGFTYLSDEDIVFLTFEGRTWSFSKKDVELVPDIEEAARLAAEVGHEETFGVRLPSQLRVAIDGATIPLRWSYNKGRVHECLMDVAEKVELSLRDAKIENGERIRVEGEPPRELDLRKVEAEIERALTGGQSCSLTLRLEPVGKSPRES